MKCICSLKKRNVIIYVNESLRNMYLKNHVDILQLQKETESQQK